MVSQSSDNVDGAAPVGQEQEGGVPGLARDGRVPPRSEESPIQQDHDHTDWYHPAKKKGRVVHKALGLSVSIVVKAIKTDVFRKEKASWR